MAERLSPDASASEEVARGVGEPDCDHHQRRSGPEPDLRYPVRSWCAAVAVLADLLRPSVETPSAVTDKAERNRGENRLVGLKDRQVADPGAANAGQEQRKRNDAAGCGAKSAKDAADGEQTLGPIPARCDVAASRVWRSATAFSVGIALMSELSLLAQLPSLT